MYKCKVSLLRDSVDNSLTVQMQLDLNWHAEGFDEIRSANTMRILLLQRL